MVTVTGILVTTALRRMHPFKLKVQNDRHYPDLLVQSQALSTAWLALFLPILLDRALRL